MSNEEGAEERKRLAMTVQSALDEIAPRAVMNLVTSDAFGIPRPHHVDELVDELALRVDDLEDVIRVAE